MTQLICQADAEHLPLADRSVDLVFCSPPYLKARWYGDRKKHARKCVDWVDWMLRVVREGCRVSRGLVLVNCAGSSEDWRYSPGPEMLLSEWWKQGGECWRPCYWNRVGIPGSGGKDRKTGQHQWFRADIEYILAFKADPGPLSYANAIANGHPPRWAPGGSMSHRLSDGKRVNQWGHSFDSGGVGTSLGKDDPTCEASRPSHTEMAVADPWGKRGRGNNLGGRNADGSKKVGTDKLHGRNEFGFCGSSSRGRRPDGTHKRRYKITRQREGMHAQTTPYEQPVLANPGNLLKIIVGGGVMGHELAHENEAPFPLELPSFFIRSHCPPGGTVLDPFGGSGTTAHAALLLDRGFISCDVRESQVNLMKRRLASVRATLAQRQLFAA